MQDAILRPLGNAIQQQRTLNLCASLCVEMDHCNLQTLRLVMMVTESVGMAAQVHV